MIDTLLEQSNRHGSRGPQVKHVSVFLSNHVKLIIDIIKNGIQSLMKIKL